MSVNIDTLALGPFHRKAKKLAAAMRTYCLLCGTRSRSRDLIEPRESARTAKGEFLREAEHLGLTLDRPESDYFEGTIVAIEATLAVIKWAINFNPNSGTIQSSNSLENAIATFERRPRIKKPGKARSRKPPRAVVLLQVYLEKRANCGKTQKEWAQELRLTPSKISKAMNHPKYGPGLLDQLQASTIKPESFDILDLKRRARPET